MQVTTITTHHALIDLLEAVELEVGLLQPLPGQGMGEVNGLRGGEEEGPGTRHCGGVVHIKGRIDHQYILCNVQHKIRIEE